MDYHLNLAQRAEELARIRLPNTWELLPDYIKQQEIEWAIPQAEKALEWAAETAHQVCGPNFSKEVVDSMLIVLGVIPEKASTDLKPPPVG